jgi:hypothetical protein
MTSLKVLAAAVLVAMSVPAIASERSEPQNVKVVEFTAKGRTASLIEGRNSALPDSYLAKARAATSQGFAPIDTESLILRGFNR